MPRSSVYRRISAPLSVIAERVTTLDPPLPAEGIDALTFANRVLMDVDPDDVADVIGTLARRGLVWVSVKRGAMRVFAARPSARVQWAPVGSASAMGGIVAVAAPHVLDILNAIQGAPEGRDDAVRVSAHRAGVALLKSFRKCGGRPSAISGTLFRVFPAEAVRAILLQAPWLQRDEAPIASEPATPKRLAPGASVDNRIVAAVRRAGADGKTITEIAAGIRPALTHGDLTGKLAALIVAGTIEAREHRSGRGRPAIRYCDPVALRRRKEALEG